MVASHACPVRTTIGGERKVKLSFGTTADATGRRKNNKASIKNRAIHKRRRHQTRTDEERTTRSVIGEKGVVVSNKA